ncbi:uncharacterized protein LOC18019102 [Eutrema salsugineum]|uniref:uncharacterized protein LOC18019102 n=1 Tax=Eutrema salsugineum TaxID=72664 RepID=UPI000CED426D|nr:uncharacterized protein LOC18019102 [Eutrema salsugineum]
MVVIPPIPQLSRSPSSNAAASDPVLSRENSQGSLLIPDALSLVSAYLNHLRRNNSQTSGNSMGNEQECGPTRENQIPTQSLLDRVVQTRRQLLIGEMAQCLSNISMVLEDRLNRRDSSSQILRQERATESETRLSIVGNSLIQLGQNISRIGMGERPGISVVHRSLIEIPQSSLQTSNGAGNLPLVTIPRDAVIRSLNTLEFLWPSPRSQQHVRLAGGAVNTSSPQQNTEEELTDSDSDSDSEREMEELTDLDSSDSEREMSE